MRLKVGAAIFLLKWGRLITCLTYSAGSCQYINGNVRAPSVYEFLVLPVFTQPYLFCGNDAACLNTAMGGVGVGPAFLACAADHPSPQLKRGAS